MILQVPEKFPFMKHPPSVVHEPAVSPAVDSKDSSGGLVLSWEQLSNYEGFQAVDVAVGMPASLCMIIAHTQQVFIIKEGGDLALQVSRVMLGRVGKGRSHDLFCYRWSFVVRSSVSTRTLWLAGS